MTENARLKDLLYSILTNVLNPRLYPVAPKIRSLGTSMRGEEINIELETGERFRILVTPENR